MENSDKIIYALIICLVLITLSLPVAYNKGEQSGYDWGYDICKAEELREDLVYYNSGDAEYWFDNYWFNGTEELYDSLYECARLYENGTIVNIDCDVLGEKDDE